MYFAASHSTLLVLFKQLFKLQCTVKKTTKNVFYVVAANDLKIKRIEHVYAEQRKNSNIVLSKNCIESSETKLKY
jgi:hypothetical protein